MTTAGDLTTRARRRADMVNSQFVTDAEIRDYLGSSCTELLPYLQQIIGQDRFVTPETVSVPTSGTGSMAATGARVVNVTWTYNGRTYPLQHDDWQTAASKGQRDWTVASLPRYRVQDSTLGSTLSIAFDPAPTSTQSVVVWSFPELVTYADAATVHRYGSEELVVLGAVIRMLQKQESPVGELVQERERLLQRALAAPPPDFGGPKAIARSHRWGAL